MLQESGNSVFAEHILQIHFILDYLQIKEMCLLMRCDKKVHGVGKRHISCDGPCICYPCEEKCFWKTQPRIENLTCQQHLLMWDGMVFRSKAIINLGLTLKILTADEGSKFEKFRYVADHVKDDDGYTTGYFYSYHESGACALMFHGTASAHYNDNFGSLNSCLKVRTRMIDGTLLNIVLSVRSVEHDEMFNLVLPKDKQLFRLDGAADRCGLLCVTRKQVDTLKSRGFLKPWIKYFSWITVHETLTKEIEEFQSRSENAHTISWLS